MARDSIIKSVGRTLALLEFFDEVKRPATVMEVSRALGYPQSSTSALLRSLVTLGYCDVDATSRRYAPTARVTLLGSWLDAPLIENGALICLLNDLNHKTGEHVLLAALNGLMVRYIYTVPARRNGRPHIRTGAVRPLGRSGAGNLFLSLRPDKEIAGLIRRLNAEERNAAYHIDLKALMAEVAETRRQGYAVALDRIQPGIGGVTVLLPRIGQMQPTAIAISSLSDVIARQHGRFFEYIRDGVIEYLEAEIPSITP